VRLYERSPPRCKPKVLLRLTLRELEEVLPAMRRWSKSHYGLPAEFPRIPARPLSLVSDRAISVSRARTLAHVTRAARTRAHGRVFTNKPGRLQRYHGTTASGSGQHRLRSPRIARIDLRVPNEG